MPVIVVALLEETPNADTLAAVVFAVAAFTDGLDGYIARSRGSVTTFGKLMDPLADKLLIIAPLISLVSLERIAAWVAMVIIAREFAVTELRMVAVEQGVVIPAVAGSARLKTITAGGGDLRGDRVRSRRRSGRRCSSTSAVAMTVVSGADYFFGLRRQHRGGAQAQRAKPAPGSRATRASSRDGASAWPTASSARDLARTSP